MHDRAERPGSASRTAPPEGRRASKRRALSFGLAVLSLALLAWLGREHLGELHRIADVPLAYAVALLALFLLSRALAGEVIRIALRELGHPIARGEGFMLAIVTNYANLLVPRSGIAPPAFYLRLRHDVAYASYLSLALATTLLATGLVGVLGVLLHAGPVLSRDGLPRADLALLFAMVAVLATVGLVAPSRLYRLLSAGVRERLSSAHSAWLRLAASRAAIGRVILMQTLSCLVRGLRLQIALAAAGVDLAFADALGISLLADLGALISLTPAALGFREGAIVYAASLVGVDPALAMLAAVIDRIAYIVGVVVLGQLFVWRGLRDLAARAERSGLESALGGAPLDGAEPTRPSEP